MLLWLWFEEVDGKPVLFGMRRDGVTRMQAHFADWVMAKRVFPNVPVVWVKR